MRTLLKLNSFALILILVLILNSSCENLKQEFSESITSTFHEFGRKIEVREISKTNNELNVSIYIYSPSFLDEETHKLMLSLLTFKLYDKLEKYDNLNFIINDEKFEHEPLRYSIDNSAMNMFFNNYNSNPLFVELLSFSLSSMTQDDLLRCNLIIKELNKLMPDEFNFNGSFWLFLENFSKSTETDSTGFKQFRMFSKVTKVPEFKINHVLIDSLNSIYNKKDI